MPIVLEHQPAGATVGMAAYAAGKGQAREREKKQLLELYKNQQRMQFQAGLQERSFGYAKTLQEEREKAANLRAKDQRTWQEGQAKEGRKFRLDLDKNRWMADRYDLLTGQLDEFIKEGGGHIPNTPEGQAFWDEVKKYKEYLAKAQAAKGWDPANIHKTSIPLLAGLLGKADRGKHIMPRHERPNATTTTPDGRVLRNMPDGTQEFVDFTDEGRFKMVDGVKYQRVMTAQGIKLEPLESGKPEKSYATKTAGTAEERKTAAAALGQKLGFPEDQDEWQDEQWAQINPILDRDLPWPEEPGAGQEKQKPRYFGGGIWLEPDSNAGPQGEGREARASRLEREAQAEGGREWDWQQQAPARAAKQAAEEAAQNKMRLHGIENKRAQGQDLTPEENDFLQQQMREKGAPQGGGQVRVYDPKTKTFDSPASIIDADLGGPGRPQELYRSGMSGEDSRIDTAGIPPFSMPAGAIDLGNGAFEYKGRRYKWRK